MALVEAAMLVALEGAMLAALVDGADDDVSVSVSLDDSSALGSTRFPRH